MIANQVLHAPIHVRADNNVTSSLSISTRKSFAERLRSCISSAHLYVVYFTTPDILVNLLHAVRPRSA